MSDFPKEYNKETLEEMYSKLKLSLSDERIELLRRYFEAMNNFYQIIPLKRMFRIINSQNDEQYSEEEFLAFAEIVRHERHYYFILGKEELYDDVPDSKPFERELVHESLLGFDDYYEMADVKYGRPYYVPAKDELLKYEDEFYEVKTSQYNAMANFVRENISQNAEYVEDVMSEILFVIRCDDSSPEEAISFLTKAMTKVDFSEEQFSEFSKLYLELHNNTRNPYNNGFTPAELLQRTGDYIQSYYLREPTLMNVLPSGISDNSGDLKMSAQKIKSKKVGRNDPCPCGSGKKYKKCCGK